MKIQINTDKTINGDKKSQEYFTAEIKESLDRYEANITRIELHIKDENGHKEGFNEVSCVLEARLEGRQPIAVTNQASSVEIAVSGAIDKIKTAIETILGRLEKH